MSFLIKNVFIIDGTGTPGRAGEVLVEGERIIAAGQRLQSDSDMEIIDGEIIIHQYAFVKKVRQQHSFTSIRT